MPITPQSAKAKGRSLQKWIVDKIMLIFNKLQPGDVESRSMGANGVDIMLSPAAGEVFPYAVEAKNLAKVAVYSFYDQASKNAGKYEPLVILKANRRKPLALVDAEHFIQLVKDKNEGKGKKANGKG